MLFTSYPHLQYCLSLCFPAAFCSLHTPTYFIVSVLVFQRHFVHFITQPTILSQSLFSSGILFTSYPHLLYCLCPCFPAAFCSLHTPTCYIVSVFVFQWHFVHFIPPPAILSQSLFSSGMLFTSYPHLLYCLSLCFPVAFCSLHTPTYFIVSVLVFQRHFVHFIPPPTILSQSLFLSGILSTSYPHLLCCLSPCFWAAFCSLHNPTYYKCILSQSLANPGFDLRGVWTLWMGVGGSVDGWSLKVIFSMFWPCDQYCFSLLVSKLQYIYTYTNHEHNKNDMKVKDINLKKC